MKCRSGLKEKRGRRTRLSSRESEETTTERKKFGEKKKKKFLQLFRTIAPSPATHHKQYNLISKQTSIYRKA